MNKFIAFIFTFFVLFISTSIKLNAQYISVPEVSVSDSISVNNLNKIVENAKIKTNNGGVLFFSGLATQAVGTFIMFIPTILSERKITRIDYVSDTYIKGYTGNYVPSQDTIKMCNILGYAFVATGSILEIIGCYYWWDAKIDLKCVQISAIANGFVINF